MRPDVIQTLIDAYEQVQPTLLKHQPGFPTADALKGRDRRPGSRLRDGGRRPDKIERRRRSDHPARRRRPTRGRSGCWRGAAPTRSRRRCCRPGPRGRRPELDALVSKLRVYAISDQDDAGPWIRREFPALHYIAMPSTPDGDQYAYATWTGISGDRFYKNAPGADFTTFTDAWVNANIRSKGRSASSIRCRAASTKATRRRSSA